MKLKKFRIKNYKSITDSGDCYLTDTITILAGKNESGKTSILEALEDFDTNKTIRETAKSIKSIDPEPEISITFVVEKDTLKEVFEEIKSPLKATEDIDFEVIKFFPDKYLFGESTLQNEIFGTKEIEKNKKDIKEKWRKIKTIREKYEALGSNLFDFEFSNLDHEAILFTKFMIETAENIVHITDVKEQNYFAKSLLEIQIEIGNLVNLFDTVTKFLDALKQKIPNFILFNLFEDILPNKILIAEFEQNEWAKDVSAICNLSIETIRGTDDREKEKHKDDVNIKLNEDYAKFWTQDVSYLSVNWDSEYLYFWIKDGDYAYEPDLRSKGRQWHFAFYIKVSARANENVPNIILIDEPGLYLHAKAQKDILGKLEDSAKKAQLIFSTHSPYLLEFDKLNRVRLIHKTKDVGTKIENKVHALADKETLTPILTAIGLELNAGILAFDKVNNVIVEGPSDVYYCNAFKKLLNNDNVHFIFGGGAGNMPLVGTILHGWGGKVVYLYDNDQGKKDGEKNLKDNWLITKDLILAVLKTAGSIEDIFSPSDFKKFVLADKAKAYTETNSEHVKKEKLDKVLLAKRFLETCKNVTRIQLDIETSDNIAKLFKNIDSKF